MGPGGLTCRGVGRLGWLQPKYPSTPTLGGSLAPEPGIRVPWATPARVPTRTSGPGRDLLWGQPGWPGDARMWLLGAQLGAPPVSRQSLRRDWDPRCDPCRSCCPVGLAVASGVKGQAVGPAVPQGSVPGEGQSDPMGHPGGRCDDSGTGTRTTCQSWCPEQSSPQKAWNAPAGLGFGFLPLPGAPCGSGAKSRPGTMPLDPQATPDLASTLSPTPHRPDEWAGAAL